MKRMLERRPHDRVPRWDAYWTETLDRWQAEGMSGEPVDLFDFDCHEITVLDHSPFPGREELLSEDAHTRTVVDRWGATIRQHKHHSSAPEHQGWSCDSARAWHERIKPKIAKLQDRLDINAIGNALGAGRRAGRWCCVRGWDPWGNFCRLTGYEILLVAMADDPEWVVDMSHTLADQAMAQVRLLLDAGIRPDGLFFAGDMGFSTGPACSPQMYRDLIWPDQQRLAQFAHDHGMHYVYHTDGAVRSCIDLYIAAGIDCLQPLEAKAGLDLRDLVPEFGNRISFWGNVNAVELSSNDRQRIREEITKKLAAGMARNGYAYHSDHSVPPKVSWTSYRFVMELLDRLGRYE